MENVTLLVSQILVMNNSLLGVVVEGLLQGIILDDYLFVNLFSLVAEILFV